MPFSYSTVTLSTSLPADVTSATNAIGSSSAAARADHVHAIQDSTIIDADIAPNAAIASSKIAAGTAGQILMSNATPATNWATMSGDITIDSAGVTNISSGVIVDADVNASAAIKTTKLSNPARIASLLGVVLNDR